MHGTVRALGTSAYSMPRRTDFLRNLASVAAKQFPKSHYCPNIDTSRSGFGPARLARPGTLFGGGGVSGRQHRRIAMESSKKSIGRLRWVIGNDREDLANYDAAGRSLGDNANDADQESPTKRVLKNLALIRAYEAKSD